MKLNPVLDRSGRVWMVTVDSAPRDLVDVISDALIDFGPDGHCDGAEEIAAIALQWCKDNPIK